jgi:hypothetical protein
MSKYREQAIKDVAENMGVGTGDVEFYMRKGTSLCKLVVCAVSQRERVLELEEALRNDMWQPLCTGAGGFVCRVCHHAQGKPHSEDCWLGKLALEVKNG